MSIAYELKEEFGAIDETSRSVKAGQRRIQKWLNQAQVLYRDSTLSIRAHLEEICNYFISHAISGVMEGINTRIKLIMRQGYEFTNFNNFRDRLFACFSD